MSRRRPLQAWAEVRDDRSSASTPDSYHPPSGEATSDSDAVSASESTSSTLRDAESTQESQDTYYESAVESEPVSVDSHSSNPASPAFSDLSDRANEVSVDPVPERARRSDTYRRPDVFQRRPGWSGPSQSGSILIEDSDIGSSNDEDSNHTPPAASRLAGDSNPAPDTRPDTDRGLDVDVVELDQASNPGASGESNVPVTEAKARKSEEHSEEPPAKMRRTTSPDPELDGETCPICLEMWASSGDHRLVALKCGHLFGQRCVERWLQAQAARDRSCPTCKSRAGLRDVRHIYAQRLLAADNSQIHQLMKQIEQLQAEKSRVELELQKSKITHRACVLQLEVLRNTLLKSQTSKEQPSRKSWRFSMEKNMEISKDGGCRVLTYNCRTYELYVSQKSTNSLFPGYGIRKVSCVDYKLGQFVHLHPKPIRDITYSQPRDLLLSVALDSSARIVERGIPSTTVQSGFPLWSCSWDYLRSNEFYVGGVGGVIHQYDVRNPSTYVSRLTNSSDMSPVVSICSTEYGLLSCQLNSCWLWVNNMRQWEPKALPIEGPFMSLCYDNESHRAVVSCRPNATERSKLSVCKLKNTNSEVLFDIEQTFHGSTKATVMSRAGWVKAGGWWWVAAHSESEGVLQLHGVGGARGVSLQSSEPALDVCSAQVNGDTIVAALSETRLRLYKSVAMNS